jgi:hypothetical protein
MNDPFAQDHEVEPLMDDFTMGTGKGALRRKEDQTKNQVNRSCPWFQEFASLCTLDNREIIV